MINIFNLFLILLALWVMLMFATSHVSWIYIFLGITSSLIVSVTAFNLNLIDKKSQFLYLSSGFFRHFFLLFSKNFFSSLKLIIDIALGSKNIQPSLHRIRIPNEESSKHPALFLISINISTGVLCVGFKGGEVAIHAINQEYFRKMNFRQLHSSLDNVDDSNLV